MDSATGDSVPCGLTAWNFHDLHMRRASEGIRQGPEDKGMGREEAVLRHKVPWKDTHDRTSDTKGLVKTWPENWLAIETGFIP